MRILLLTPIDKPSFIEITKYLMESIDDKKDFFFSPFSIFEQTVQTLGSDKVSFIGAMMLYLDALETNRLPEIGDSRHEVIMGPMLKTEKFDKIWALSEDVLQVQELMMNYNYKTADFKKPDMYTISDADMIVENIDDVLIALGEDENVQHRTEESDRG